MPVFTQKSQFIILGFLIFGSLDQFKLLSFSICLVIPTKSNPLHGYIYMVEKKAEEERCPHCGTMKQQTSI